MDLFLLWQSRLFTFAPEWAALGLRLSRLGKPRAEPLVPDAALGRHVYRLLALLAGVSDGRLLCTEGKYLKFTSGPQCPWPGRSTHADAAMFLRRFALTSSYVKPSEGGREGGRRPPPIKTKTTIHHWSFDWVQRPKGTTHGY